MIYLYVFIVVCYLFISYHVGKDYSDRITNKIDKAIEKRYKNKWDMPMSLGFLIGLTLIILFILYGLTWPIQGIKNLVIMLLSINYVKLVKDYFAIMYYIIWKNENET